VVDADPHADPPWMVTAYIEGPSLEEAVRRYGPLPPGRVRALGAGLAEGLAAIHANGLVHRDLKPGNVIMAEDGPRIIDFGIARALDATGLTSTGMVIGTFAYMSPEQVRGDPVMPVSDVFSLGSMLAFAATGRPPFGGDTAAAIIFRILTEPPDLADLADQELRALIEACLVKPLEARPPVQAVLAALTGRVPLPAGAAPQAPGRAIPFSDSRDPTTQTGEVAPGTFPPRAVSPPTPPPRPVPPADRRPRRRSAGLIAGAALIAVLATVIPLLLATSSPGSTSGHGRSTGPSPGSTLSARDITLHAPRGTELTGLAFSPDGKLLAAGGGQNKPTYVWDITAGRRTALTDPSAAGITAVAISPNGKFLADADSNNTVFLWNLATSKLIGPLIDTRAGGYPYGVAFSPDSKLLATGEASNQTDLWDVATGKLIKVLKDASPNSGLAFSPDGTLLAAAGRPAFLWDVATGRRHAALYGPGGRQAVDVAFSPDGKVLASADAVGTAYLWDVATGSLIATLPAPYQNPDANQNLNWVTFSPDGSLVVIADANGHAYLWNAATHKLVGTFTDPSGAQVEGVAFRPDGRVLAVSDDIGNVYLRITSQLVS
jgi:WD40 repeat protein